MISPFRFRRMLIAMAGIATLLFAVGPSDANTAAAAETEQERFAVFEILTEGAQGT